MEDESEMGMLYKAYSNGPFKVNSDEIEKVEFFPPGNIKNLVQSEELDLSEWAKKNLIQVGII